jgi:hypothetical protein
LADLLKPLVVARSAAHPKEILGNDRVICAWQLHEPNYNISGIARSRSHRQAELRGWRPARPKLG